MWWWQYHIQHSLQYWYLTLKFQTNTPLSFAVHRPPRPDKVPTDPKSFVAQECSAGDMFFASGAEGVQIPQEVYQLFSFIKDELKNAWFAVAINDERTTVRNYRQVPWFLML